MRFPILFCSALIVLCGCEDLPEQQQNQPPPVAGSSDPQYVGSAQCASCHAAEFAGWESSHHHLAMQPATEATVLAPFNNVSMSEGSEVLTFAQQTDQFTVAVTSETGADTTFTMDYVFGVDPLQQYLVDMPNGSKQALTLAWDTREEGEGGGRWFSLQNENNVTPDDPLHWTGPYYNWNKQCADCHVTDFRKNYDLETGQYASTWAEVNVSCEACHGPASGHLAWLQDDTIADFGFVAKLAQQTHLDWQLAAGAPVAAPQQTVATNLTAPLVETCAPCHSRRSVLDHTQMYARPLADTHRVSTLDANLYFPDGQMLDEVYVYGSFVQSKMSAAGVTCSNCHDPHTARLKAPGAEVCLACHAADSYDSPAHHHHTNTNPEISSQNVNCVSCHMPVRTYMGVDDRHDHSFRIPRPDLTATIGVPNTCNACHEDQSAGWAAKHIENWTGEGPPQHFGSLFAQVDKNDSRAREGLLRLIEDDDEPGIVRASAIRRLGGLFDGRHVNLIRVQLRDSNALVRREAVTLLAAIPGQDRVAILAPLLKDPALDVRLAAVVTLADIPSQQFSNSQLAAFNSAMAELEHSYSLNADRADSTTEMASFYASLGQHNRAETLLKRALAFEPSFVPASINLADIYRSQGNDQAAHEVLEQATMAAPGSAALQHALGLAKVRQGNSEDALPLFALASKLAPDNPYYILVHAIAINSTGKANAAIVRLTEAMETFPHHTDITMTLAMFHRDAGNLGAALSLANRLDPMSQQTRNLISDLQNRQMLERYQ